MEAPSRGTDLSASHQPQLYAIAIATYCLAFLAVTLRFISRSLSKSSYWLDDWLIVFALVTALSSLKSAIEVNSRNKGIGWRQCLGFGCLQLVSSILNVITANSHAVVIPNGYGKHVWTGPPNALYAYALGLFMQEILYASLICLVKFSILAFYWRIFNHVVIIRMPIYILGALVGCWGIACVSYCCRELIELDSEWYSSGFGLDLPVSSSWLYLETILIQLSRKGTLWRRFKIFFLWQRSTEYYNRFCSPNSTNSLYLETSSADKTEATYQHYLSIRSLVSIRSNVWPPLIVLMNQ